MKKILYSLIILSAIATPFLVGAQTGGQPNTIPSVGGNAQDVGKVINKVINFGVYFIWLIAVAYIVYAAYQYLTSSGDEDKVKDARKIITYAIIAIIIAFLARSIVALIINQFLVGTVSGN